MMKQEYKYSTITRETAEKYKYSNFAMETAFEYKYQIATETAERNTSKQVSAKETAERNTSKQVSAKETAPRNVYDYSRKFFFFFFLSGVNAKNGVEEMGWR